MLTVVLFFDSHLTQIQKEKHGVCMYGLPMLNTPEQFFNQVIGQASQITDSHLDSIVYQFRKRRNFKINDFREAIEKKWERRIQIFTAGDEKNMNCIKHIRYCFDANFHPINCTIFSHEGTDTENKRKFRLQTELEGWNQCPRLVSFKRTTSISVNLSDDEDDFDELFDRSNLQSLYDK